MNKITWNNLQDFMKEAGPYLAQHEANNSKLIYAVKKVKTRVEKLFETLREQIEDIMTESYYADEKGILETDDEGRFRVTKDALKTRNKAHRELMAKVADGFEPYFATKVPDDLTEAQLDAFEGIVVSEAEVARIRKIQEGEDEAQAPEAAVLD